VPIETTIGRMRNRLQRGKGDGNALDHWLQVEAELAEQKLSALLRKTERGINRIPRVLGTRRRALEPAADVKCHAEEGVGHERYGSTTIQAVAACKAR
jgi:hypothetical protein